MHDEGNERLILYLRNSVTRIETTMRLNEEMDDYCTVRMAGSPCRKNECPAVRSPSSILEVYPSKLPIINCCVRAGNTTHTALFSAINNPIVDARTVLFIAFAAISKLIFCSCVEVDKNTA